MTRRSLSCEEAQARFFPGEELKLVDEDMAEAMAQVEGCPSCQAFFEMDRELLAVLEELHQVTAPREVRERVFDALARERTGGADTPTAARPTNIPWGRNPRLGWIGLAAGLAVLLWGGWSVTSGQARAAGAEAGTGALVMDDYLRRAVSQDFVETRDAETVRMFLAKELRIAFRPLSAAGLELLRAEICLLDGKRGALILYEWAGRQLSHYVVPAAGVPSQAPMLSDRGPNDVGGRFPVVTWARHGAEEALVGELPAAELLVGR